MSCPLCEETPWYPSDPPCPQCRTPNPLSKRAGIDALFGQTYVEDVTEGNKMVVLRPVKTPDRPLDQRCGGGRRVIKKRLV
jgi:hypothetical protein